MEALIGAIFLDRGLARARRAVARILTPELQAVERGEHRRDYKTLLQEEVQRQASLSGSELRLQYAVVDQQGPDHDRIFRVQVSLGARVIGEGQGKSKKEAEQRAAQSAWQEFPLS